ncbi:MAG: type VI secretion system contractile sheath large subunit [Thiohalomonadales bacterium]
MPSFNQNSNTITEDIPIDSVSLDALYQRQPYITNIQEFLSEKNTVKALIFWLTEHSEIKSINSTEAITLEIHSAISNIDNLINEQLNIIIHHPKFQKLESSWRGLYFLADQVGDVKNIKLKFLDISWPEVVKDISRALDFDQSNLFKKIYSEEYGTAGGEPYGALIGDYEISHRTSKRHPHDDLSTLSGLSEIAAAAFAPFIAGASSELFGLDNFSSLGHPLNLQSIFTQKEYAKWHTLRDKVDTRFVGLTLPRILMRLPYRTNPGSYKGVFFYEHTETKEQYLWGNACYGFASILLREFNSVGWFGHIRGMVRNQIGGGLLTSLPVDSFKTDSTNIKPVTDVIITDTLEREISDLGFIPLCQCYDTPFAAFYNNQSIHKPVLHASKEANVNAKLSVMLQHILCGSRIAHYIKVIIRDKIGSLISAKEVEEFIQDWLHKYTTGREDLEWEEQARYPLRQASVKVREHPSKPGQYLSVIHLQPHYQLDHMVSELELATELLHTR